MERKRQVNRFLLWLMAVVTVICVVWTCSKVAKAETGSKDGLEVSVETDKEEYVVGEEVQVFIKAVNNGTEPLSNITIDINVPEGVKLAEGTSTKIVISSLEQGETNATEIKAKAVEAVSMTDTTISVDSTAVKTGDSHTSVAVWVVLMTALGTGIVLLVNPKHRKKATKISGILACVVSVALFSGMVYANTAVFEINKTIKIGGIEKTIHVVISYEIGSNDKLGDASEDTSYEDTENVSTEDVESVKWKFEDGTLNIYGKGEMEDYDINGSAPWLHEYCKKINTVVIEDGVTNIGDFAFYGCSNLTSIEISDSVTNIGMYAFFDCSSLESIEIPDNVTDIRNNAFMACRSLTSITIPDGVTNIEMHTFMDCISLTSIKIPDSVTSIGSDAFMSCSSLTSIEIPDSVTNIGMNAFYECSSLTSIEIPSGVTSIGNDTFWGCSSLTSIEIPNGVISIGNHTFNGCSNLTSIEMPDSVTSIGNGAFMSCSSLTSIKISSGVISIGDSTFWGCSGLTSIEIPNGVTSIGDSAFNGCSNLTSIEIPDSVTFIADDTFENCSDSFVIYGASGSYVETYVNKHSYTFIAK